VVQTTEGAENKSNFSERYLVLYVNLFIYILCYNSNIQGSTTSYTETAASAVNSHLSRGIKLRVPNEEHIPVSSSIADSNGINSANLLDQDDSAVSYDNSLVPEGNAFLSNYIPAVDPNEPVYCICRQVSFGEMIGCDGEVRNLQKKKNFFLQFKGLLIETD
jgi:hypothetical protein